MAKLTVEEREEKEEDSPKTDTDIEDRKNRQIYVFTREKQVCEELIDIEPDCKWVLLTYALLLGGLEACLPSDERQGVVSKVTEIFTRLCTLDPMRAAYYEHVRSQLMGLVEK